MTHIYPLVVLVKVSEMYDGIKVTKLPIMHESPGAYVLYNAIFNVKNYKYRSHVIKNNAFVI